MFESVFSRKQCNNNPIRTHVYCICLRHCTASWKVAGSILDEVIGISYWPNPSGRTMALGSTQPLQNWVPWWPVGRIENHATFMCQLSSNAGCPNLLEPVWACSGIALLYTFDTYQYGVYIFSMFCYISWCFFLEHVWPLLSQSGFTSFFVVIKGLKVTKIGRNLLPE